MDQRLVSVDNDCKKKLPPKLFYRPPGSTIFLLDIPFRSSKFALSLKSSIDCNQVDLKSQKLLHRSGNHYLHLPYYSR